MQLYHHPYSLDSQKVRMALEEKGIDYTSYHINPLTGKNMNVDFFRMNPSAKLPVFQNGAHVIYRAIDIIQYVLRSCFFIYWKYMKPDILLFLLNTNVYMHFTLS
jgi:glutathione S-transferase